MTRAAEAKGFRSMVRGGLLNLVGTAISQVSLLATTLVITRTLGRDDLGVYAQAFALRTLLEIFSLAGLRNTAMRYVARFRTDNDTASAKGTIRLALVGSASVAVVAAIGLFLAADWLAATAFDDPDLAGPFRWVALSLPAAVITSTALGATQGFRSMKAYAGIGLIADPVMRVVLTLVLILAGLGVEGAMIAMVVASSVSAVLALWQLRKAIATLPGNDRASVDARPLFSFSMVSWLSSLSTRGLVWGDVVILGLLAESADVGVYAVASRAVLLASLATRPLNAALSPSVAADWQAGEHRKVREAYDFSAAWAWRLGLAALAIVVALPLEVLGLFGDGFSEGRAAILILAAGALLNTQGAQASVTLNMTDAYRLNLRNNVGALVTNIGLNIVLVPRYGIEGAAIAWSVTLGLFGMIRVYQLRSVIGPAVKPFDVYVLSGLAAVAGGLMGSLVNTQTGLILAAPVALIVYVGLTLRFALTERDRELIGDGVRVARRVPVLDRLLSRLPVGESPAARNNWPLGEEPISVRSLIEPNRRDVYVRAEFMKFAREQRQLRSEDFEAFLTLAYQTPYYQWWVRDVENGTSGGGRASEQDLVGFRQRVQATASLVDLLDSPDRSSVEPIKVRRTTLNGADYALWEGEHRLAAIVLEGREYVQPHEYRVGPEQPPMENGGRPAER